MARIAYYRVSTDDQSVEAQRHALGGNFDKEFTDEDVSGFVLAQKRRGFGGMVSYIREGDTLCVFAVDRLGRDALDIQSNVRSLIDRGVTVDIYGLGPVGRGVGEIIVAVLAQVAEMEARRIKTRCDSGRAAARASLEATGKTHRGKASLGRPVGRREGKDDVRPAAVVAWRKDNRASIRDTAEHFGIGKATVTRYCAAQG
jgi:putative DNA-invertase from lambdoid prophage Rac